MNLGYSLTVNPKVLETRFGLNASTGYIPFYNAYPTRVMPLILNNNPDLLRFAYWGTHPGIFKNSGLSRKLYTSLIQHENRTRYCKKLIKQARCIVPADGFYDWKTVGKKTKIPYRFNYPGNEIVGFAGIWEYYEDHKNTEIISFRILTEETNGPISEIIKEIPVVIPPVQEKTWLGDNQNENILLEILQPGKSLPEKYYTVTPKLADINFDGPELMKPMPAADQSGNLTLFH